jgi:hypothetical protein
MRGVVDAMGAPFGWSKRWSDAPSEWWHVIFMPGIWGGAGPGPSPSAGRTLTLGATGDDVSVLQQALRAHDGGDVVVDGSFGPGTETAVRTAQSAHRLVADGIVGPATRHALGLPSQ